MLEFDQPQMESDQVNPVRRRARQFSMPGGLVLFRQGVHVLADLVGCRFGRGSRLLPAALHWRPLFLARPVGGWFAMKALIASNKTSVICLPSAAQATLKARCRPRGIMNDILNTSSFIEGDVFAMGVTSFPRGGGAPNRYIHIYHTCRFRPRTPNTSSSTSCLLSTSLFSSTMKPVMPATSVCSEYAWSPTALSTPPRTCTRNRPSPTWPPT